MYDGIVYARLANITLDRTMSIVQNALDGAYEPWNTFSQFFDRRPNMHNRSHVIIHNPNHSISIQERFTALIDVIQYPADHFVSIALRREGEIIAEQVQNYASAHGISLERANFDIYSEWLSRNM